MTCLRLPGGTDAAEMALFDVDALSQSRPPMGEGLDELVTRARLVRLPTGGDGGYLLHLYVDERVPESILQYCLSEDKLTGQFATSEGRIAFGGVESTFKEFQPNRLIRSDGTIAPGSYCFTAYRTDIPDEVVSKVANVASTSAERWLDRAPRIATLATLALRPPASRTHVGHKPTVKYGSSRADQLKRAERECRACDARSNTRGTL